jgi:hypothetical protein
MVTVSYPVAWFIVESHRRHVGIRRSHQSMASLAAFPNMMRRDRKREGLRVCRAAWLIGVTVRECREMEAGERTPSADVYVKISELYGWPQGFARPRS